MNAPISDTPRLNNVTQSPNNQSNANRPRRARIWPGLARGHASMGKSDLEPKEVSPEPPVKEPEAKVEAPEARQEAPEAPVEAPDAQVMHQRLA